MGPFFSINPRWFRHIGRTAALVSLVVFSLIGASKKNPYSPHEKAYYTSASTVQFVRPGLVLRINSAQIAADGTISAIVAITDPAGLPLDRSGISTPGTVALSFVAATIPKNQDQYTSYTTRTQRSPITGASAIQAGSDTGGSLTAVSEGVYKYTFGTKAPSGFDTAATHTIGVYGSRDLSVFSLGINYASTTYNFVPNGSAVSVTRAVVQTASCNNCHDQLSAHGGSRRGVEMCVLCHTPQTTDPDTGNTVDLKVMVHKIHMGSSLPSVQAGKPYQIIGFNQTVLDWSSVVYPADARRCGTCHQQVATVAQTSNHFTKPTREACGSCHDNANFATGENHAGGPQFSDNLCATCHIPKGEIDFDASIEGSHVIPVESSLLSGLAVSLVKVQNGTAGTPPAVTFTIADSAGKPVPTSALASLSLIMAGPTTDYGYTSFGSDVTTPGYVSESALGASCGGDGTCVYTFRHSVPSGATGTFSIGVEARRTETVLAGTTKQQSVTYATKNQVINFSVDGSPVAPRRTIVEASSCAKCHVALSLHGGQRNQPEHCVLCHNPSTTDSPVRGSAVVASDRALPPQGVNFNLLVHRIHSGENLLAANKPYIVVGFGGSHNDFSDVRYPAMSPTGAVGDTRNCSMCHVNGSEQNLPTGLNAVTDPQGPINPVQAVTSACTGCHVQLPTASHALANTTSLGESCSVCHNGGAAFSVGKVHAQY